MAVAPALHHLEAPPVQPHSRRAAVASALERSGLGALLRLAPTWNGLLVLNLHRVGSPGGSLLDRNMWDATVEEFDAQVRFLTRNVDVVAPGDVDDLIRRGRGRGRHVLITFDDGYRDNHRDAFPILRAHGATATFFITTGFLDDGRLAWWDELAWMVRTSPLARVHLKGLPEPVVLDQPDRIGAITTIVDRAKTLPGHELPAYLDLVAAATESGRAPGELADMMWMSWDDVREMVAAGMEVGGHTVSHPILARMDGDGQRAEIAGCKRRIEAELGRPMRWFSYPNGDPSSFDERTRRALAEAGVELAFSFGGGYRGARGWDPYDVRRIAAGKSRVPDLFAATVTLPQVFGRPR
jgi:peptidoglycan/xylan/chitin deacetylase (PgdA/CDA1 family)